MLLLLFSCNRSEFNTKSVYCTAISLFIRILQLFLSSSSPFSSPPFSPLSFLFFRRLSTFHFHTPRNSSFENILNLISMQFSEMHNISTNLWLHLESQSPRTEFQAVKWKIRRWAHLGIRREILFSTPNTNCNSVFNKTDSLDCWPMRLLLCCQRGRYRLDHGHRLRNQLRSFQIRIYFMMFTCLHSFACEMAIQLEISRR